MLFQKRGLGGKGKADTCIRIWVGGKRKKKKIIKGVEKGGFLTLWGKTALGVLISECIYI